jgi:hypothetical protein
MKDDGFFTEAIEDWVYFADKPDEAVAYLQSNLG